MLTYHAHSNVYFNKPEMLLPMKKFFKVKLSTGKSSKAVWIAVRATNKGDAIVIAEERCLSTPFDVTDAIEISEKEYQFMMNRAGL